MDNHNHHPNQQQQQQQQEQHLKHQQEEQQKQHQQQETHQDKDQQQQQQQKHEEQVAGTEQKSPTVSQFPLTRRTNHSPPPDPSPLDSPLSSDTSLSHAFSPPPTTTTTTASQPSESNSKPPSAAVSRVELSYRDQLTATTTTATTTVELEEQTQKLGSGSGKRLRPDLSILRRTKRDKMIKKALLGFRVSGFVFCLVSFSVLAADKDQGWALDSFYRYKEFRFCMAVNVIGFVYSGFQAYDLAYQLTSGKQKLRSQLRLYLDFVLDQILAYLLISASSSAAVRIDDWQSNWGKNKFPEMARASMAMSMVAFIALALSSLVSGYNLCTFKSM